MHGMHCMHGVVCAVGVVDLSCFARMCARVMVSSCWRPTATSHMHKQGWSLFSGFQGQGSVFDYVGVSLDMCGKEVLL